MKKELKYGPEWNLPYWGMYSPFRDGEAVDVYVYRNVNLNCAYFEPVDPYNDIKFKGAYICRL